MRTIIAGSRTCFRYVDLLEAISAAELVGINPSVVLSGLAVGVDQLGIRWAKENYYPIEYFPANWMGEGRAAGYRRNERMALQADALIAVWYQRSKGTGHMIDLAHKHGLLVAVWEVDTWKGGT